jgi:hypothetical protein
MLSISTRYGIYTILVIDSLTESLDDMIVIHFLHSCLNAMFLLIVRIYPAATSVLDACEINVTLVLDNSNETDGTGRVYSTGSWSTSSSAPKKVGSNVKISSTINSTYTFNFTSMIPTDGKRQEVIYQYYCIDVPS